MGKLLILAVILAVSTAAIAQGTWTYVNKTEDGDEYYTQPKLEHPRHPELWVQRRAAEEDLITVTNVEFDCELIKIRALSFTEYNRKFEVTKATTNKVWDWMDVSDKPLSVGYVILKKACGK